MARLLARLWDHNPEDKVGNQPGNATGDKSNKEGKAKPEGTDTEEFSEPSTDTSKDTIAS